jgi:hypothetical protein
MADFDVPMFKTANEFSMHIENVAQQNKQSYLDAILDFCNKHMIDPEEIASKVNKSLKDKLEHDFRELNYLPKKAQLDV